MEDQNTWIKIGETLPPILDKLLAHMKRIERINLRPVKKPRRASKKKLDQASVQDSGSVTLTGRE